MEKTTISSIQSKGKSGNWNEFLINLNDGKSASLFTSKDNTTYREGDEVEYETELKFGKLKFKNINKVNIYSKNINSNQQSVSEQTSNKPIAVSYGTNERIAKQVAIKASIELICAGKTDVKTLFSLSNKIYSYLISE